MAKVRVTFNVVMSLDVVVTPIDYDRKPQVNGDQVVNMVREWLYNDLAQADEEWDHMITSAYFEVEE